MTALRLATLILPATLWSMLTPALAGSAEKPAPARAAAEPARAEPAAGDEADPMDRLRRRLTERLAGPNGPQASGTLDLRVSGPKGSSHAGAAPKAVAPAGGGAAPAHGASAHDIGAGRAEGIAWSRPEGAAERRKVMAATGHDETPARAALAAPAARSAPATPGHGAAAAHGQPAPARRAAAAAPAGDHAVHWDYEGAGGPASWGALRPEYGLCSSGQRQSPIDIRGGLAVDLEPVKFDYRPSAFAVIDNGHTVQVNVAPGNSIEVGSRRFELVQFHFHRPSEERIDGRQFEMSLHLVHKDAEGKLAVVGLLLARGPALPAVQTVWNNLPLEKNQETSARGEIDPSHFLPEDRRYFTYMGSLTTPPCSEGVLWVVMRTPVTATPQQIELFSRLYPMNARPVQSASGRRIMQSQ